MRVEACERCGGAPSFATVCHPLHFPGTVMGTGKCLYEPVAYCPRCDETPAFDGPIEYFEQTPDEYIADAMARFGMKPLNMHQ